MGRQGFKRGNPYGNYWERAWGLVGIGYDENVVSRFNQNVVYRHYFDYLMVLALGRFKWSGLPDTVSAREIELSMIFYGNVLYFNNDILGNLALPSTNIGRLDVYDIPKTREVYRANGFHQTLTQNDSVLVFNDDMHQEFISEVSYTADRLTEIDIAKRTNVLQQQKPKILGVTSDTENSVKQMLNQAQTYKMPYILMNRETLTGMSESANVLDMSVPIILKELQEEKIAVLNEYLTRLGYNNINVQKTQHLTVDESNSNNEQITGFRFDALKCRQEGCEKINKMFGTNISVEFSSTVVDITGGGIRNQNAENGENVSRETLEQGEDE